jgi:PAS domain S-box-containing protein
MTSKLEQEVAKLKQGDHLCMIYESSVEQLAVVVPFIRHGLARGERCIYIADDGAINEVMQPLAAAGVDVARERQRGALRLGTWKDTYLRCGEFDPQAMIDSVRQAEVDALKDGFSGMRLAGEMTWALGTEPGCERWIEFEALLNHLLPNSKSLALGLYNHSRFNPIGIHDVLRTSPLVILGDEVCPNAFYELPEMVLCKDQAVMTPEFKATRVNWWIAQLKRARAEEFERERALEKLRQSERRLAEAQRIAQIGSFELDLPFGNLDLRDDQPVFGSDEMYRLFGLQSQQGNLSQFMDRVMPHDADRIRSLLEEAIRERRPFSFEYRITRPDGIVRVLHEQGSITLNAEGKPVRLVGTVQDVTQFRQADQARKENAAQLQALSRRLLEVQEEERRHLALELHDEVGQLLTGLRLLLKPNSDAQTGAGPARLEQAQAIVDQLLDKIRGLSFDLRPAVLDELGLIPALLELFENYTKQTGVQVRFRHKNVERRFAPEVETTAYRIVQEALTNAARHAGAGGVTVRVWAAQDLLSVQIEDGGRGFDAEAVLAMSRSSGLAGMRERVMLLNGQLTIDSKAGAGTQITAELPLGGEEKQRYAALAFSGAGMGEIEVAP